VEIAMKGVYKMSKNAQKKYDKENTIFIGIKLNKKTDKEIIEIISSQSNKQGFIKKILKEFAKNS
jgi:hypothetical protein